MKLSNTEYQEYVQRLAQPSPLGKNMALAFLIGGAICTLGQLVQNGWMAAGAGKLEAGTLTSVTMIFLSVLLTGLNLYNKLARFGGAGTLVASLASLITFNQYRAVRAALGRVPNWRAKRRAASSRASRLSTSRFSRCCMLCAPYADSRSIALAR